MYATATVCAQASVYQKNNKGKGERTKDQQESFSIALEYSMDLWYAHQGTVVYMLTELPKKRPKNSTRKCYDESGWCASHGGRN